MIVSSALLALAICCAVVLPIMARRDPQQRCLKGKHRFDQIDFDTRVCVQCGHREVREPCHPADCDPDCPGEWRSGP